MITENQTNSSSGVKYLAIPKFETNSSGTGIGYRFRTVFAFNPSASVQTRCSVHRPSASFFGGMTVGQPHGDNDLEHIPAKVCVAV